MNQKEAGLRAGGVERNEYYTLYWEPYYDNDKHTICHGFTVETNTRRWRFETLSEAEEQIQYILRGRALDIARAAFGREDKIRIRKPGEVK